jgi:glutathionylspermidine synthase
MRRVATTPRPDWPARLEARGFPLHTADGPYWDESAAYAFTAAEIATLEKATGALHALALEAVGHAIDSGDWWERLRIPAELVPSIVRSWEANDGQGAPSIYGRLDLAWTGDGPPKLLEYNADTPTALVEAAVAQWDWLEEVAPDRDQFNSIHDRLVAGWKDLAPWLRAGPLHFTSGEAAEDVLTATYLQDTAAQGGLATVFLPVDRIGWDGGRFVDERDQPILQCFKLYPWEWMAREEFGGRLAGADTTWIEPPWKMIASRKSFLALLWELAPGHPNLLRASLDEPAPGMRAFARKPILGREGGGVLLVRDGAVVGEGPAPAEQEAGWVFQELYPFDGRFDGRTPVIGSWLVQGEPAGIGLREDAGPVTGNASQFLPHYFE